MLYVVIAGTTEVIGDLIAIVIAVLLANTIVVRRLANRLRAELEANDHLRILFKAVAKRVSEGIILFGPDERVIYINERVKQILPGLDAIQIGAQFREMVGALVPNSLSAREGLRPEQWIADRLSQHDLSFSSTQYSDSSRRARITEVKISTGGTAMLFTDLRTPKDHRFLAPAIRGLAPARTRFIGFSTDVHKKYTSRISVQPSYASRRLVELKQLFALPNLQALYDRHGSVVEESRSNYIPNDVSLYPSMLSNMYLKQNRTAPRLTNIPDEREIIKSPVLFGGVLFNHYGHFLTDSMARLWATEHIDGDVPIAFVLHPEASLDAPFVADVFRSIGISGRILIINKPTLFLNCLLAEPALQHSYRIFADSDSMHLKVTEIMCPETADYGPVYLSRAGQHLRTSGSAERELEQVLQERGFRIVAPELLPLSEQIGIFNSSPVIVGPIGSAFHTSLFSRRDYRGVLAILCDEKPQLRFPLVDAIKSYGSVYINCMTRSLDGRSPVQLDVKLALALLEEAGIFDLATA